MTIDRDFEANVLRIAAGSGNEPIFYHQFGTIRPTGAVGGWWLYSVKKILIENEYIVHERNQRATWQNQKCDVSLTHFHRRHQDGSDYTELQTLNPSSDTSLLRNAIDELLLLYEEISLEPVIWRRDGPKRNPYRVLIVMGLSQQISDEHGLRVWPSFLAHYPNPKDLQKSWQQDRTRVLNALKPLGFLTKKSVPIIEAALEFGDSIPSDTNRLVAQHGIGKTIAEKIVGYGYGKPALPFDGQANRVIARLRGNSLDKVDKVRTKLKDMFPKEAWMEVHEVLRLHGQAICKKQAPSCSSCPVSNCKSRLATWSGSVRQSQSAAREVIDSWDRWRQLLLTEQLPFTHRLDFDLNPKSKI